MEQEKITSVLTSIGSGSEHSAGSSMLRLNQI